MIIWRYGNLAETSNGHRLDQGSRRTWFAWLAKKLIVFGGNVAPSDTISLFRFDQLISSCKPKNIGFDSTKKVNK